MTRELQELARRLLDEFVTRQQRQHAGSTRTYGHAILEATKSVLAAMHADTTASQLWGELISRDYFEPLDTQWGNFDIWYEGKTERLCQQMVGQDNGERIGSKKAITFNTFRTEYVPKARDSVEGERAGRTDPLTTD